MKMPLIASLLERLLIDRNLVPGLLLDFLGAEAFRAFSAARRLGVFDALAHAPSTVVEIARTIGADVRGTGQLLRALEAIALLGTVSLGIASRLWIEPECLASCASTEDQANPS